MKMKKMALISVRLILTYVYITHISRIYPHPVNIYKKNFPAMFER